MQTVSLLTPTFNRRPFIPSLIQCIRELDYPTYKMEWIIIDDGTDSVEDLFKDKDLNKDKTIPRIRYYRYKEKMTLGKKRNLLNKLARGDILVCIDDDDYYPPERVKHAVYKLNSDPKILCGASSMVYCWFNEEQSMYIFGPYGKYHGTANTFAYKREFLNQTRYNDNECVSEESYFLKGFKIPIIQFDPLKTVIQIAHNQNSFDKSKLKNNNTHRHSNIKKIAFKIKKYIKNAKLRDFYTSPELIHTLNSYDNGKIEYKPDIVHELKNRNIIQ